jgi:PAP2 superfamily
VRVGSSRFEGLLPLRLKRYRPPRWWQEIALVLLSYWLYGLGRNALPAKVSSAERHGRAIQHLQEHLNLDFELSLNRFFVAHEPIAQVADYYYATLHFVVTITVLVWLYCAHPRVYRGARTALFSLTLIALLGFWLYPVAPPRLLPASYGYVDTVTHFHTWGSLADPGIASASNQFAAMPSLHISWAVWCAATIFMCARRRWVRYLALCYPWFTFVVILGTANHYVLDAVGGVATAALGFGVQWLASGLGAYREPIESTAPDRSCRDLVQSRGAP